MGRSQNGSVTPLAGSETCRLGRSAGCRWTSSLKILASMPMRSLNSSVVWWRLKCGYFIRSRARLALFPLQLRGRAPCRLVMMCRTHGFSGSRRRSRLAMRTRFLMLSARFCSCPALPRHFFRCGLFASFCQEENGDPYARGDGANSRIAQPVQMYKGKPIPEDWDPESHP